jgi:hypothetical protein
MPIEKRAITHVWWRSAASGGTLTMIPPHAGVGELDRKRLGSAPHVPEICSPQSPSFLRLPGSRQLNLVHEEAEPMMGLGLFTPLLSRM